MSGAQLSPGAVIDGYTVQGLIRSRPGAGTYGVTDAQGAAAELTVYSADCFPSALVLERSLRELRQVQPVSHPHIVPVRGCGKWLAGLYEVHGPVDGPCLADRLKQGPLTPAEALTVLRQVGDGLLVAQGGGVIHRSLGADVVFLGSTGAKVGGFCVALPQGGRSYGALDCIAPEQVEGKVVDQRTLIYNLAALRQFMVAGRPLFWGDPAAVLAAHLGQEPPEDLPSIWRRALAKDPRSRPMMLHQFLAELAGLPAEPHQVPSTRGWTMFTEVDGAQAPLPTPASTDPASPGTSPAASASDRPSTRGWTMFMQAADSGVSAPAVSPPPSPAAGSPPAPNLPQGQADRAPAPVPAPGEGVPQPTTRGWTMFIQGDPDPTQPSGVGPSGAGEGPAQGPAPSSEPRQAEGAAPTTRGWTMFTSVEPAPGVPVPGSAPGSTPSGGGATPFAAGPAMPPATPGAEVTPSRAPSAGEHSDTSQPRKDEAPSKRGWTVFMDAPLNQAGPQPFGPQVATEQPSDQRGWTVFGMPGAPGGQGPAGPQPGASVPAAGPQPGVPVRSDAQAPGTAPSPGELPVPGAEPPRTPWEAPSAPAEPGPETPRKTIVAAGLPSTSGASGSITGRTVFAQPGPVDANRATAVELPVGEVPEGTPAGPVPQPRPPVHAAVESPRRTGKVVATLVVVTALGAAAAGLWFFMLR